MKWLRWTALAIAGSIILLASLLVWVLNTTTGTRWAFARLSAASNGAFETGRVDGTLAGPLTLESVRYRNPRAGIDAAAELVVIDVALRDLLRTTVHVTDAQFRGLRLTLSRAPEAAPQPARRPFSLATPIDIVVDRFRLADAKVARDDVALLDIQAAAYAGQWVDSNVLVRQLDMKASQGEVHLTADVREGAGYDGTAKGRFRWQVGARTFAGSFEAQGRASRAHLQAELTAPLEMRIDGDLEQTRELPWNLTIDAPAFDPRKELLPGSSLYSLSARLTGHGSVREAFVEGELGLNDLPIRIDHVHVERRDERIALDGAVRIRGGTVAATGTLDTRQSPLVADLRLKWADVVVPASLVGQELFTQGDIGFRGGPAEYRADGDLKIGPAGRIASLKVDVHGTPQRVRVEHLDVVQAPGRLAMSGEVNLAPNVAWTLRAQAHQFDPGAFAAAWRGSLDFDLASDGAFRDSQPQGRLTLENLRGRLRDRSLGGRVDLTMSPGMVLAGSAELTSGQSRLQLTGQQGETMNAVATLDVSALNDWLPSGSGELHGRIEARGRWPELEIEGRVSGTALKIATVSTERLALDWNIARPKDPSGAIALDATRLELAGLRFDSVRATASGDTSRHTLELDATGAPVAAALLVQGSRTAQGWSGTVERMMLDVTKAARLTLQRPVDLEYSPQAVRVSEACFADLDIRLCLEGERRADGAMHARYGLDNVPLGLANAFMPASMPLTFVGTIGGRGDIARSPEGVFSGNAEIRSATGRIERQLATTAAVPEVLLTYTDFDLTAALEGANARMHLASRLDDSGTLEGQLSLRGLSEPVTEINGTFSGALPTLRVIELFAPQLANVRGRADLRASVRGTIDAPQVDGEFRASELAAGIPALGLELKDGSLSVIPTAMDSFKIEASMGSGSGRIEAAGSATIAGRVQLRISGQNFQAADIPSANVLIDPQLDFERTGAGMKLTGKVHVPVAAVNLEKLPHTRRTQNISADVVVVDAETEEAQVSTMPLVAQIVVSFGDKVTLTGFGLDARVLGQLTVNEQPNAPTTGSGEVRVEGTYKAYGQDLTIRQGQLLFARTPLDNPRVNIVAVRELDEVTAGLRVTGSARAPQLEVFSDPAMGQSDALAYLVTGKPLSEVGTGAGEGDALQSAARSLGTAAGGLLAKNVGQRLGISEVGIKENAAIGGAALTVGQYLSPRLYLSYGVGLFEPGQVFTVRYKLSRELAIEALNGPQDSRAGFEWRAER